jgi:hypothetical protein
VTPEPESLWQGARWFSWAAAHVPARAWDWPSLRCEMKKMIRVDRAVTDAWFFAQLARAERERRGTPGGLLEFHQEMLRARRQRLKEEV